MINLRRTLILVTKTKKQWICEFRRKTMARPITYFVIKNIACSLDEMSPGEDYVDPRWQFLCFS